MRDVWGIGIIIFILGLGPLQAVNETYPEIRTTTGVVYKNCTVTKVEPDALTIIHASGGGRVSFEELPADLQKFYQYDPKAAQQYISQKIARHEERLNYLLKHNPDATISTLTAAPESAKPVTIPTPPPKPQNRLTKAEVKKLGAMIGFDSTYDTTTTKTYQDGEYVRDLDSHQAEALRKNLGLSGSLDSAAAYAQELKSHDLTLTENRFLDNVIKAAQLVKSNSPDEFRRMINDIRYYIRTIDL